ncbi:MAG: DUF1573 domain-containing protein [Planctomycetota bacterium]
MSKYVFRALALALVVVGGVFAYQQARQRGVLGAGQRPEAPAIRFDRALAEFGSVVHGSSVVESFTYWNGGSRPLDIYGVETTCGCTLVSMPRYRLDPGERAELVVEFDTLRKDVKGKRRSFEHHVTLSTNDPMAPAARLTLRGEVFSRFEAVPSRLYLAGGTGPGAPTGNEGQPALTGEAVVFVRPREGSAEALVSHAKVRFAPPEVQVTVAPVTRGADGKVVAVEVTAKLDPDAPVGRLETRVELETGDPEHPVIVIPVNGLVRASVSAAPGSFVLTRGGTLEAQPVSVTSVTAGAELLSVTIEEPGSEAPAVEIVDIPEPGQRALPLAFGVRLRPAGAELGAGSRRGVLRILTTDPRAPLLEVRYTVKDPSIEVGRKEAFERAGIAVRPGELLLRTYTLGERATARVNVRALGKDPIAPTDFAVSGTDLVQARGRGEGRAAMVYLEIDASRRGGFAGEVSFRPVPGAEPVSLPFRGDVKPATEVDPGAAVFAQGSRAVRLRLRRSDQPITLTEVQGLPAGIGASFEALADGSAWVTLTLSDGASARAGLAGKPFTFTIVTDQDPAGTLTLTGYVAAD